jgi:hypothetical protein
LTLVLLEAFATEDAKSQVNELKTKYQRLGELA